MASSGKAIVLVVEDDTLLRMQAVELVEEAGLQALEAANADEAIILLETNLAITIVFTDIEMPGSMDGLKLAAAVRRRWPPVEIIVVSGRANPDTLDLPDRSLFFAKPYSQEKVVAAMRHFSGFAA